MQIILSWLSRCCDLSKSHCSERHGRDNPHSSAHWSLGLRGGPVPLGQLLHSFATSCLPTVAEACVCRKQGWRWRLTSPCSWRSATSSTCEIALSLVAAMVTMEYVTWVFDEMPPRIYIYGSRVVISLPNVQCRVAISICVENWTQSKLN